MMPKRIQLMRTKGWRKPDGVVVVSRPTKWGNPFTIASALENGFAKDTVGARELVVACFRDWLYRGDLSEWWFFNGAEQHAWIREHLRDDLYGKDLACWCPLSTPCHADVLLEAARV